jgi:hypothetical protein
MKLCKHCGKELIGKERFFCKGCSTKIWSNAKVIGGTVVGAALLMVGAVLNKDKLEDLFNDSNMV